MPTSPDRCVACGRPGALLCSSTCLRDAVVEREDNVRHLRALRRSGDVEAGVELTQRNGELAAALLAAGTLEHDPHGVGDEANAGAAVGTESPQPG